MGGAPQEDEGIITGINVTPLVDIVLVLLIIFMVTARFMVAPSIEVELPEAATGEETEASTVAFVMTREGTLYLNGKETSEAEIRRTIPEKLLDDPKLQAIISADTAISHGRVIWLIDLVRQLGITKFALNIDPPESRE